METGRGSDLRNHHGGIKNQMEHLHKPEAGAKTEWFHYYVLWFRLRTAFTFFVAAALAEAGAPLESTFHEMASGTITSQTAARFDIVSEAA